MFPIRHASTFYLLALAAALALTSGCGGAKLKSTPASNIVIDGEDREWTDRQFYFKDERITIGVAHDDQHFYLYLNTVDRALQMQVLRRGFTVLFDSAGGNKTSFGVHYPLAMDSRAMWDITDLHAPLDRAENKERVPMGSRERRADRSEINPAMVAAFFEKVVLNSELELLGKTVYDKRRLPLAAISEVEVALNYIDGRLVYELKVPLQRLRGAGYEVGIGARAGKDIGIGFSTPKIDRQVLGGQRRRGGSGGFGGGDSGGFPGGGGGFGGAGGSRRGPPGDMQPLQQPLQLWTKIVLSSD